MERGELESNRQRGRNDRAGITQKASKAMIETTRTTAGYRLYNELAKTMHFDAALDETRRRVEIRAERVGNDGAHIWTRLDGGEWVDEGMYRVAPLAYVALPDEDDVPFDPDLAAGLL